MKLDVSLNLDDVFGWEDDSIATTIKEELKAAIRKEIANAIKNDATLKTLVAKMQKLAVKRAIEELTK